MPDNIELTIEVEADRADTAVVRCQGRLTITSAAHLRHEVKALLQRNRIITIDLSDVHMMDSVGLGTIVALYLSARTAGGELHVVNLKPRIRELFSIARVLSLFETAGDNHVQMP
jgi:anti-anti-sigma factor